MLNSPAIRRSRLIFPLLIGMFALAGEMLAAPFPGNDAERVIKQAVVAASPSLVRIETVGGADVVDEMLTGTGPTTGVVVSEDGYIITSSFNFSANPATVLATLAETNQRLPAQVIAHDRLKNLTLLKVEASGLIPGEAIPEEEIKVGQWALALGRTYDQVQANISLGLISALGRMEGKALQTDAKVSPANYGGPLVNLRGQVFGVLTPLSQDGSHSTGGVNWYDSGIGFAVPMHDIYASLDRLKSGDDLRPGLIGISFASTPSFMTDLVVQEVRPNSPASEAGIEAKDTVVAAAGKPVETVAQLRQVVGRMYAGDTLSLTIKRAEEEQKVSLELAAELEAFQHGLLGLLPQRAISTDPGVTVRHILADTPAAQAGLKAKDRIISVDGQDIADAADLARLLSVRTAGEEIPLTITRDGNQLELTATLGNPLATIPAEIPLPFTAEAPQNLANPPETGDLERKVASVNLQYDLYVPEDYRPGRQYGLVMWMSSKGETLPGKEMVEWKRICRTRGLILLRPRSVDGAVWSDDDALSLETCLDEVEDEYQIAAGMTAMFVTGAEPTFLWQFAWDHRDRLHGLASSTVPSRTEIPFNEPGKRFSLLLPRKDVLDAETLQKLQAIMQNRGLPFVTMEAGEELTADDFDALGRWLETLSLF
ncbi:PDZ domain-containing protein [Rubinisphaera margarita]|uniref:PDZ domain-containing protein n=1 Tax=Rubinisphaera margarita TaxID=2909586 RepID=UPI001EE88CDE|nr:PDZ domain-containing protein [Rubinisphaera margarita]MCG6157186.1 PDZ domain-containing protein [Rubinisphaera margarita]